MEQFPRLFELESRKYCKIKDRLKQGVTDKTLYWQWKRNPVSPLELTELCNLELLLQEVSLKAVTDRWTWEGGSNSSFSVKRLREQWASEKYKEFVKDFKWCNWVPLKVALVAWRATLDKLPTKVGLQNRGIMVSSNGCALCEEEVESSEHLFFSCRVSQLAWVEIGEWCKLGPIFAADLKDLLGSTDFIRGNARWRKMVYAIFLVMFWVIWRNRNDRIFNNGAVTSRKMVEEVKMLSFLWLNHRSRKNKVEWRQWLALDRSIML